MKSLGQLPQDDIYERGVGCLLGLAVGNAMGKTVEGLGGQQIEDRLDMSADELTGSWRQGLAPGAYPSITTDALLLAESIVDRSGIDTDHFARRLNDWPWKDTPGSDAQTAQVLEKIAAGSDWEEASIEVQATNPLRAGNGSLVRSVPVALYHRSPDTLLIEDSRLCSRVTHPHAQCQWSCAFAGLITVELIGGSAPRQAVDSSLGICGHRGDVPPQLLLQARDAAFNEKSEKLKSGNLALDTLACSIWALSHNYSFDESITAALGLGGDTNAIGALTGALAGAAYGKSSIAEIWLKEVDPDRRLEDLAASILELI
jgi:ADP-ribosyl-[dinitrogen reductase] hydrolase